MLENFQDIKEIHKIIVFETGHSVNEIADRLDYSRPHLAILLKGRGSDEVILGVINRLKGAYKKEILQFVSKYTPVFQKQADYEVTVVLKRSQLDRISLSLNELDSAFLHARRASTNNRPDVTVVPLSGKRKPPGNDQK